MNIYSHEFLLAGANGRSIAALEEICNILCYTTAKNRTFKGVIMAVSDEVIWQNVLTHFADFKGFDSRRDQLSLDTETGEVHVVNRDDDFTKKGALCGCICGLIFCNCSEVLLHREACSYRKAVLFSFFECDHGAYACPLCDECTCGIGINDAEWQEIRATRRVWVALSFGLVGCGFVPARELALSKT